MRRKATLVSRVFGKRFGVVALGVLAAGALIAPVAKADRTTDPVDCTADVGDPPSGSVGWDIADNNNRYCAVEGLAIYQSNVASQAANVANVANGASPLYRGDPFRDPLVRWGGVRGDVKQVSFTNRAGRVSDAILLSPRNATPTGSLPGVIIPCHSCFTSAIESGLFWAAEAIAEEGYVVMVPYSGGNDANSVIDATDYLVSTPSAPNPHKASEVNPWWQRLDRTRLGVAGHSGAGGLALTVGHTDPRFSAVVAFDPAFSGFADLTLRTPTMVQVADYNGNTGRLIPGTDTVNHSLPLPVLTFLPYGPNAVYHTKPEPAPGSKYTYFDGLRAAGVDSMQVSVRATTHIDWGRPSGGTFSTYGEMTETYYALAWFDRYLRGASDPATAADAERRLTATGTFDGSADVHSIGTGFFDAQKAKDAGSVEAGNVPITIGGQAIRTRVSYYYPTRFFLDGGALQCGDVRAGCTS